MVGRPFVKGQPSGGRRQGARNRLTTKFLESLAKDFEEHGEGIIKIARVEEPMRYLQLVASVLPKEFEITDNRLADLSDEELDVFIAKLRAQLRGSIAQELGDGEGTQTQH